MPEIIGRGGERDKASIWIETRKGNRIPNERRQERSPQSLQVAVEMFTRRPSVRLRSATGIYNCMGLIFASRRTCIDVEHINWILSEDGYYKVEDEDRVVPGDLILYRDRHGDATHVGVVLERRPDIKTASWKTTVLSQWGADGEYRHEINDVHESLGYPSDFFSERKERH